MTTREKTDEQTAHAKTNKKRKRKGKGEREKRRSLTRRRIGGFLLVPLPLLPGGRLRFLLLLLLFVVVRAVVLLLASEGEGEALPLLGLGGLVAACLHLGPARDESEREKRKKAR